MASIALDSKGLCPCGSGRLLSSCCARGDRLKVLNTPKVFTAGKPTGFSLKGCYAAALGDCSARLSREHFISKGLLEKLAGPRKTITVDGLREGNITKREIGINSFTSKVLCERHNTALSQLDSCIIDFFESIAPNPSAETFIWNNDISLRLFNGHALERWLLKVGCGMLFSRNLAFPGMAENWSPPINLLDILFSNKQLSPPAGLYLIEEKNDPSVNVKIQAFGKAGEWTSIKCTLNQLTLEAKLIPEAAFKLFDIKGSGFCPRSRMTVDNKQVEIAEYINSSHVKARLPLNISGNLVFHAPYGRRSNPLQVSGPKALFRPPELYRNEDPPSHIFLSWSEGADKERVTLNFK